MGFANEAAWDRIGRVAIGIVLLYIGWAEVVTGGWGTFFKLIGNPLTRSPVAPLEPGG